MFNPFWNIVWGVYAILMRFVFNIHTFEIKENAKMYQYFWHFLSFVFAIICKYLIKTFLVSFYYNTCYFRLKYQYKIYCRETVCF